MVWSHRGLVSRRIIGIIGVIGVISLQLSFLDTPSSPVMLVLNRPSPASRDLIHWEVILISVVGEVL